MRRKLQVTTARAQREASAEDDELPKAGTRVARRPLVIRLGRVTFQLQCAHRRRPLSSRSLTNHGMFPSHLKPVPTALLTHDGSSEILTTPITLCSRRRGGSTRSSMRSRLSSRDLLL